MRHSSIRSVGSGDGCPMSDSVNREDTSFNPLPSRRAGDNLCHQLRVVQWHLATTQIHSRASARGWSEARLTESGVVSVIIHKGGCRCAHLCETTETFCTIESAPAGRLPASMGDIGRIAVGLWT